MDSEQEERAESAEPIQATELAAQLYAKQGYLVIGATRSYTIGEFVPRIIAHVTKHANEWEHLPLRVIGESNADEFEAQCILAAQIKGDPRGGYHFAKFFYRVEAVD